MGAGAGLALMGAGTLLNFQAQKAQGEAQKQAAYFNAQENERYAKDVLIQASKDQKQLRANFRRDEASNLASVGSAGIQFSGSALDVLRDNARMMEADVDRIQDNAEREAAAARRGATQMRRSGRSAKRAGDMGAVATLFSGGAQTYLGGRDAGVF